MLQTTTSFSLDATAVPPVDGAVVAALGGHVDYGNAADLRHGLMKILAANPEGGLVLELSAVESLDTAAAAVLVETLLEGRKRNIQVLLCGSSPGVRRLFELSGLDEALQCCSKSPAETKSRLQERNRT